MDQATITLPDGYEFTVTDLSLTEADTVPYGSGFISSAAGAHVNQYQMTHRERGRVVLADGRTGEVEIRSIGSSRRAPSLVIKSIRFYLPEGWD